MKQSLDAKIQQTAEFLVRCIALRLGKIKTSVKGNSNIIPERVKDLDLREKEIKMSVL